MNSAERDCILGTILSHRHGIFGCQRKDVKEGLCGNLLAVGARLCKLLELYPAAPLRIEISCASCLVDGVIQKLLTSSVKASLLGCFPGQVKIGTALKLILGAIRGEVSVRPKGSISNIGIALHGMDYTASSARHRARLFGAATDR
jgi:hypothetical protein